MPPKRRYQRARTLLQECFGAKNGHCIHGDSPWMVVSEIIQLQGFAAFSLFLCVCCNAMEDISYMSEMNMPSNMCAVVLKLPYKLPTNLFQIYQGL